MMVDNVQYHIFKSCSLSRRNIKIMPLDSKTAWTNTGWCESGTGFIACALLHWEHCFDCFPQLGPLFPSCYRIFHISLPQLCVGSGRKGVDEFCLKFLHV